MQQKLARLSYVDRSIVVRLLACCNRLRKARNQLLLYLRYGSLNVPVIKRDKIVICELLAVLVKHTNLQQEILFSVNSLVLEAYMLKKC